MALNPGTRFGPYEIVEKIGAGGMGEVYRATDTALKRDVAVKVLPASFANDRDRLDRFQREAEVLASLNHPNIAQIFGLDKADGQTVIVMELVEGPTLAERIAQGPLPPDEALAIARQVADALEAAHGRQVVHRDLKPANVKVKSDGTIKILDFGIAKTVEAQAISGGRSPAMATPAVTETGIILGTAAYMSPEQARGKPVDQRTDIWAFGCLLFEMLTGQPAFAGEDVMLTLARVLDRDTDMSSMPGTISPAVRHTIKLCLEKDPRKRIADIRDVRLALAGTFEAGLPRGAQVAESASRRALPIAAAAVVAGLLIGVAATSLVAWSFRPTPDAVITRFSVDLAGPLDQFQTLAVSPDGRRIVYATNNQLYSHRLDQVEPTVISGTEGGREAFFSPDGRSIAFFVGTQLKTVGLDGDIPRGVATVPEAPGIVGVWGPDGRLFFGQQGPYGLSSVLAAGGAPEPFADLGDNGDLDYPEVLPGAEWVLFTANRSAGRWSSANIVAQNRTTGERKTVLEGGHFARYLATGHLVFTREATLYAVAFDPERVETRGPAVPVVQGVQTSETGGNAQFAVAANGTLVYVAGTAGPAGARPQKGLSWVDRDGNVQPLPIRPDDYTMARISPDGTKIAVVVGSTLPATDPLPDIYVFELETENLTQLTFEADADDGPVWSRDGSRIFYRSYRDGTGGVYTMPSEGGAPELVATSETGQNPLPWAISPDGETLLLIDAVSIADVNLATLDIANSDKTTPLLDLAEALAEPSLSPDGRWLLYYAFTPSTTPEINIRPFPDVGQQRRPVGLGGHAVFSADGAEIFLFDGNGLSVVSVQYAPFRVGTPQMLFRGRYWYGVAGLDGTLGRAWDVDPKNDRFLMITLPDAGGDEPGEQARPRINVVLNWFEELKERVPVP
jgi:serine/threonine-protein kinase